VGVALLAVLIFYGPSVFKNISEFREAKRAGEAAKEKAQKDYEELKRLYEEDTYGGKTPEETLALFIDALKRGDTDLASKYFVIDKQDEWRGRLKEIKNKHLLTAMVGDLERKKHRNQISDGQVAFSIANDKNQVALTILVGKGANGIWKILDL